MSRSVVPPYCIHLFSNYKMTSSIKFLYLEDHILKMNIHTVYKLTDHADIKVTDIHYVDYNVNVARKKLDDITLESFLEDEV